MLTSDPTPYCSMCPGSCQYLVKRLSFVLAAQSSASRLFDVFHENPHCPTLPTPTPSTQLYPSPLEGSGSSCQIIPLKGSSLCSAFQPACCSIFHDCGAWRGIPADASIFFSCEPSECSLHQRLDMLSATARSSRNVGLHGNQSRRKPDVLTVTLAASQVLAASL